MNAGNKENMLGRIRSALGRDASSTGLRVSPPIVGFQTLATEESLVSRFRHELELVGGRVERVRSLEEIREYLRSLLSVNACSTVALSDGLALRDFKIFEWLEEQGVEIVPTLDEFVAGKAAIKKARRSSQFQSHHEKLRAEQYRSLLLRAGVGITSADYAIAETGTLVLASGGEQHRLISLLPPIHVCLLNPVQITTSLAGVLLPLHGKFLNAEPFPKAVTLITGPSCTADIEQTLTKGMHGPRELHVLLCAV